MLFDLSHEKMVFIGYMFALMDVIYLIHHFVLLLVMLMLIPAEYLLQALVYIKEKLVKTNSSFFFIILYFDYKGHPCEFLIDTMNAGAGALAVTVDGPSKVQLDCKEVAEGIDSFMTIMMI
jgi:hypothetical protein